MITPFQSATSDSYFVPTFVVWLQQRFSFEKQHPKEVNCKVILFMELKWKVGRSVVHHVDNLRAYLDEVWLCAKGGGHFLPMCTLPA